VLSVNVFHPQPQDQLFNSFAFFRLHASGRAFFFQWQVKGKVVMCLHVSETEDGVVRSPRRGTFGGIGFFSDVSQEAVDEFVAAVTSWLRAQGLDRVQVLLPPADHRCARVAAQYFALRRQGFVETLTDINYAIMVQPQPLVERMNYANRKRYNKCVRAGFAAQQVDVGQLARVYRVIESNRNAKGYPVSMTLAQLEQMRDLFADQLCLFICHLGEQEAASAICLRVSPEVLYVFYWGDEPAYAQYSPVTLLASCIHDYCREQGVELLDIGTATLDGEANHGLIRFKRALGCEESMKFRLEINLEP
jgi:hypothetical protein